MRIWKDVEFILLLLGSSMQLCSTDGGFNKGVA